MDGPLNASTRVACIACNCTAAGQVTKAVPPLSSHSLNEAQRSRLDTTSRSWRAYLLVRAHAHICASRLLMAGLLCQKGGRCQQAVVQAAVRCPDF